MAAKSGKPKGKSAERKHADWIRDVLGDRLEPADDLIVDMTAKLKAVEEQLYEQVLGLGGNFMETTSKGHLAPHPVFCAWRDTAKQLLTISSRLGLNPVARKEQLKGDKKPAEVSDFVASLEE